MRVFPASCAAAMAVVIAGLAVPAVQPGPGPVLKPASEFAAMADDKQRALALFTEAGKGDPASSLRQLPSSRRPADARRGQSSPSAPGRARR
jgi:hypothetical protein